MFNDGSSDKINLNRATGLLYELFGINRLGIVGGAAINTAFLDRGLIDEIYVLIGAGIDGRGSYPPLFNSNNEKRELTLLNLMEVKSYPGGSVLLRYKV